MQIGGKRVRIVACMLLLLSHALLLYALAYGQAETVRWQRDTSTQRRTVIALPSDSFVAIANQRTERPHPPLISIKTWRAACMTAHLVAHLADGLVLRLESWNCSLPQPIAERAMDVLRL